MFRYCDAESLVLAWLALQHGDRAVVLHDETVTKPYGWVFYYQGRDWVELRRRGGMLIGNGPVFVDRFQRDLRNISGAGTILSEWLAAYEVGMHSSRLTATAERPAR